MLHFMLRPSPPPQLDCELLWVRVATAFSLYPSSTCVRNRLVKEQRSSQESGGCPVISF